MNDAEQLAAVKSALGISGTFQNDTISFYINEVKCYLLDAGVSAEILTTETAIGVIARGVADLWNYGNSGTTLSEYFMQRAKQLSIVVEEDDGE